MESTGKSFCNSSAEASVRRSQAYFSTNSSRVSVGSVQAFFNDAFSHQAILARHGQGNSMAALLHFFETRLPSNFNDFFRFLSATDGSLTDARLSMILHGASNRLLLRQEIFSSSAVPVAFAAVQPIDRAPVQSASLAYGVTFINC